MLTFPLPNESPCPSTSHGAQTVPQEHASTRDTATSRPTRGAPGPRPSSEPRPRSQVSLLLPCAHSRAGPLTYQEPPKAPACLKGAAGNWTEAPGNPEKQREPIHALHAPPHILRGVKLAMGTGQGHRNGPTCASTVEWSMSSWAQMC